MLERGKELYSVFRNVKIKRGVGTEMPERKEGSLCYDVISVVPKW